MAKPKKRYVCQACGGVSHRWQGQCPDCAEWNTLAEDAPATVFSMKHDLSSGGRAVQSLLTAISPAEFCNVYVVVAQRI